MSLYTEQLQNVEPYNLKLPLSPSQKTQNFEPAGLHLHQSLSKPSSKNDETSNLEYFYPIEIIPTTTPSPLHSKFIPPSTSLSISQKIIFFAGSPSSYPPITPIFQKHFTPWLCNSGIVNPNGHFGIGRIVGQVFKIVSMKVGWVEVGNDVIRRAFLFRGRGFKTQFVGRLLFIFK